MVILREILKIFEAASPEGEQRLPDGTWLVSPAPEIAPKAWHHIMFAPPLSRAEIEDMESSLHSRLPTGLEHLYSQCNGLSLFGRMVSIWGRRTTWERSVEKAWQPFDLVHHNQAAERPKASPYSLVYFGSTDKGENWVFFDAADNSIGKTPRASFKREGSWPDFNTWFLEELSRIRSHK